MELVSDRWAGTGEEEGLACCTFCSRGIVNQLLSTDAAGLAGVLLDDLKKNMVDF